MCRFKKIWLVTFFLPTISTAVSQNDADSLKAFYPLHIGDLWQYKVDAPGSIYTEQKTVVRDTVFENGDRYFITESEDELGTFSMRPERVSESLEVLRYFDKPLGSGDQLIYLLDARKGDSWISSDSMTVTTVTLDSTFEEEIFGEKRLQNLYRFEKFDEETGLLIAQSFQTLTLGIGATLFRGGEGIVDFASVTLKGAIINGVQYGDVTSIESTSPPNPPDRFELYQNYPNPFNPNTFIVYRLSNTVTGFARMKIYNILGQEVVTLFERRQSTGRHTVIWDGRDGQGLLVPSGAYIYQLQVGRKVQHRKMTIIR